MESFNGSWKNSARYAWVVECLDLNDLNVRTRRRKERAEVSSRMAPRYLAVALSESGGLAGNRPVRGCDLAFPFPHHQNLIGAYMGEPLHFAARPSHFHQLGFLVFSQPKVQAHIVAGEPIASGPNTIVLGKVSGDDLHPGSDPVAVTFRPDRLHLKPMPRAVASFIS